MLTLLKNIALSTALCLIISVANIVISFLLWKPSEYILEYREWRVTFGMIWLFIMPVTLLACLAYIASLIDEAGSVDRFITSRLRAFFTIWGINLVLWLLFWMSGMMPPLH